MFKVSHINVEAAVNIIEAILELKTSHLGDLTISRGTHAVHGGVVLVCGSGEHCVLTSSH